MAQVFAPFQDIAAWQVVIEGDGPDNDPGVVKAFGPHVDASHLAGGRALAIQVVVTFAFDTERRFSQMVRQTLVGGNARPAETYEFYDYGAAVQIEPPTDDQIEETLTAQDIDEEDWRGH